MKFSNLSKCWLCKNRNLVLQYISRVFGTRWQYMAVFSKYNIEQNKCGKVYFLQIRHFFIAEMGKASRKSWIKEGTYYTTKTLR